MNNVTSASAAMSRNPATMGKLPSLKLKIQRISLNSMEYSKLKGKTGGLLIMDYEELSARTTNYNKILSRTLSMEPIKIHEIVHDKPSKYDIEGVYIISTPDDDEIVYVGKTRTKSIIGRMKDHRSIDTKSDLKGMLRMFPNYPHDLDDYLVRCVEVMDGRKRTFFAYYSIGILRPPFNK